MNNQGGPQILKTIATGLCPHCGNEIRISLKHFTSMVDWVLKPKDIDKSKNEIRKVVDGATSLSEEEKKSIRVWLDDPNTMFGPDDVQALVGKILRDQAGANDEMNADAAKAKTDKLPKS